MRKDDMNTESPVIYDTRKGLTWTKRFVFNPYHSFMVNDLSRRKPYTLLCQRETTPQWWLDQIADAQRKRDRKTPVKNEDGRNRHRSEE